MSIVIFGDSISAGSNSTSRYSDYFEETVANYAVSGTTIGEYSIYPVDGNSLLRKYNNNSVRMADKILIEYGINDVSALMCDFVKMDTIVISFIKALDGIRQLNPNAKIYFLSISDDCEAIFEYAKLQCDYLQGEYFKGYDFLFPPKVWAYKYYKLMEMIEKSVTVIPMIDDVRFFKLGHYISTDKLHPNADGHNIIYKNLLEYL